MKGIGEMEHLYAWLDALVSDPVRNKGFEQAALVCLVAGLTLAVAGMLP